MAVILSGCGVTETDAWRVGRNCDGILKKKIISSFMVNKLLRVTILIPNPKNNILCTINSVTLFK